MDCDVCTLFDLPSRAGHCFERIGIKTVSELAAKSKEQIMNARNMGEKTFKSICDKMQEIDLTFGMTDRDWLNWGMSHIEWIKHH